MTQQIQQHIQQALKVFPESFILPIYINNVFIASIKLLMYKSFKRAEVTILLITLKEII